ncbi:MAG: IclR family transcriptional regulator C-terminal domain-containing protein [Pseudolabrys sp.]|nr:IclR family transcriptional regulator C-terminal domain-containing protein [Pseudolabrys sp.]
MTEGQKRGPTSADKVLGVLSLFTAENPVWSPERTARRQRVSLATSYRYFNTLVASGMLEKLNRNQYVLGPAIVELDRKVRAADPVLKLAQPVMERLLRRLREPAAILLCRYYRQKVMCIHQETNRSGEPVSSYERGALRPMFRGATSKVILAHLPPRTIVNLWRDHRRDIVANGMGPGFEDFKANLRTLRREPVNVSSSEVDEGRTGIAAPIFDASGRVNGSLSIVLLSSPASTRVVERLSIAVQAAAREIERSRGNAAGQD